MWFRRHWYWPSGYIVVGIIVALLTNNIHLSSLSGILLSILAVLLWPFILGAALCRLLGLSHPGHRYHLTRTPQASISSGAPSRSACGMLCD
jgi:hypothetical protein